MNDFEKLKSTLDALAEEHGLAKLTIQWGGQVGVESYYGEYCLDLNIYIKSDAVDREWRFTERALRMDADLEAFTRKAVAKFIAQRSNLKAESIAKAKALLAAAGE